MIPRPFRYHRAETLDEALKALQDHPDTKVLSGGHSLLPMMKLRVASPAGLVDIGRIVELQSVSAQSDSIAIGAATTYARVLEDSRLSELMPILHQAVSVIADPQVRYRGTVGGSAVHADPASDLSAVFLACGVSFVVKGPRGERIIPVDEWYLAPLVSALAPDEILERIVFPRPLPGRQTYLKFPHPASGYPLAGVAVLLDVDDTMRVREVRIAVSGAGVLPFRALSAEACLKGEKVSSERIQEAVSRGLDDGEYTDDVQYSAAYRRHLAGVMIERALIRALDE